MNSDAVNEGRRDQDPERRESGGYIETKNEGRKGLIRKSILGAGGLAVVLASIAKMPGFPLAGIVTSLPGLATGLFAG